MDMYGNETTPTSCAHVHMVAAILHHAAFLRILMWTWKRAAKPIVWEHQHGGCDTCENVFVKKMRDI